MLYSYRIALALLVFSAVALCGVYVYGHPPALLNGKGLIAKQETALMLEATLLMLVVAVPVWGLLFFFAWRYRAGNTNAEYSPDWEHSKMDELIWWAIPLEIILVLAAITWSSTHALDPRKPLDSSVAPLTIEVVALPWKWLFIYPAQGIATVNFVEIPVNTPIDFKITADAPMNSFWIPQLGGQIYAMTGMTNDLQLIADETGDYEGLSANYSGEGFAKMRFTARSVPQVNFDAWVAEMRRASTTLDSASYVDLAKPGDPGPVYYYGAVEKDIFRVILKASDGMQMQH